jgi:hypothetical protein
MPNRLKFTENMEVLNIQEILIEFIINTTMGKWGLHLMFGWSFSAFVEGMFNTEISLLFSLKLPFSQYVEKR